MHSLVCFKIGGWKCFSSFEKPRNFTIRHPQQIPSMHVNPPIKIPNGFSPNLAKAVVASSDAWTFFSACRQTRCQWNVCEWFFELWNYQCQWKTSLGQKVCCRQYNWTKSIIEILSLKLTHCEIPMPTASSYQPPGSANRILTLQISLFPNHLQHLSFHFLLHQVLDHPKGETI